MTSRSTQPTHPHHVSSRFQRTDPPTLKHDVIMQWPLTGANANDWWLQPWAVCSHILSGVIWHCDIEINSIHLHDSFVMVSFDSISYITYLDKYLDRYGAKHKIEKPTTPELQTIASSWPTNFCHNYTPNRNPILTTCKFATRRLLAGECRCDKQPLTTSSKINCSWSRFFEGLYRQKSPALNTCVLDC